MKQEQYKHDVAREQSKTKGYCIKRGLRTGSVAFEAILWQNLDQLYAK